MLQNNFIYFKINLINARVIYLSLSYINQHIFILVSNKFSYFIKFIFVWITPSFIALLLSTIYSLTGLFHAIQVVFLTILIIVNHLSRFTLNSIFSAFCNHQTQNFSTDCSPIDPTTLIIIKCLSTLIIDHHLNK